MIVLTAEIDVNAPVFVLGESLLGSSVFVKGGASTTRIDKRRILSCETQIRDRADLDKPSFGVVSNGGHLSFKDTNKQFLGFANAKLLRGNERVRIFLENTIAKSKELVGSYFVSKWDYDNDNATVSISFVDGIEDMQSKEFPSFEAYMLDVSPKTLYDAYWSRLKSFTEQRGWTFDGESAYKIQSITSKILSSTFYNYKENLWASQNKMCQLLGLNTFINKNGKIFVTTDLNWS